MQYHIAAIERSCRSAGWCCERASPDELRVRLGPELSLCVANTEAGTDTYLGFADGSWHTHGRATLMTGPDTHVQLDPIEFLAGIRNGDLLIGGRYVHGELKARWVFHRNEKQDFRYFEAGESITIQRADPPRTDPGPHHA